MTTAETTLADEPADAPVSAEALIRPFTGIRPVAGHAADVIAPPYDVVSSEEARARAHDRPWSFLHVSKPEIELEPDAQIKPDDIYGLAADTMRRMFATDVLRRDPASYYYIYRMSQRGRTQTGLVVAASIAAYESGRIRRHEVTRPDKEADRARQIEAVGAQTSPVMLVHKNDDESAALIGRGTTAPPAIDVTTDDGVRHALWVVSNPDHIECITQAFAAKDALYIADGHHRSAAAARVALNRKAAADDGVDAILAVSFPESEVQIHPYDRVVRDLDGHSPKTVLADIGKHFAVRPNTTPVRPSQPGEFGMYLAGQWYRLRPSAETPAGTSQAARLDANLLGDRLFGPVFGVTDARRDPRLDFVDGEHGLGELQRRVDSGEAAVAFSLHPVRLADLFAIADAGETMPPKSTWFAPKLADGLISLPLD